VEKLVVFVRKCFETLQVVFQSIPQLILVVVNTVLTGQFNPIFFFAIIGSMLSILDGAYIYAHKDSSLWKPQVELWFYPDDA